MDKFPFDIIGFDLDGTLVDTSGDLTAAVNFALTSIGRPTLTIDQVKPMIGGGVKAMLQHGLDPTGGIPEEEFKPLYRSLLRYYEENISVHSCLYPGGAELLDRLDDMGVKYAVVTNKFEGLAIKLLTEMGLIDRIATVLGADTLGIENAKPSGAPIIEMIKRCQALGGGGKAAYVGDSIYDMMAAKNAGVPSVGVSFGFLHGPIEELDADAIIDDWDELVPTLQALA